MDIFTGIAHNKMLLVAILAWVIAQGLKVFTTFYKYKEIKLRRVVEQGGMPSSHSAVVCALAVSAGRTQGFDSPAFAIAMILATVVMQDAAGIRRAAGKQAVQINLIIKDMLENGMGNDNENLKELLGHTPLEVIAGAILGIVLALLLTA